MLVISNCDFATHQPFRHIAKQNVMVWCGMLKHEEKKGMAGESNPGHCFFFYHDEHRVFSFTPRGWGFFYFEGGILYIYTLNFNLYIVSCYGVTTIMTV